MTYDEQQHKSTLFNDIGYGLAKVQDVWMPQSKRRRLAEYLWQEGWRRGACCDHAEVAARCFIRNHDGLEAHAEALQAEAIRLRADLARRDEPDDLDRYLREERAGYIARITELEAVIARARLLRSEWDGGDSQRTLSDWLDDLRKVLGE